MTALATTAAVIGAYLQDQIDDELALCKLTGWANLEKPREITPNCWIFGTHQLRNGHDGRTASTFCPRFRRSNDCADLISRCLLTISTGPTGVSVQSWAGATACATVYSDHPSPDDAIRFAVCKAARAVLEAERKSGPT